MATQGKEQQDSSQTAPKGSLPSYKIGWGFFIAAVVSKLIGTVLSKSIADLSRGQSFIGTVSTLNRAARTEVFFNVLTDVLVITGIILLVLVCMVRSKRQKKEN